KEFPLSLKVGRQELSYGEERIIGAFGWNNIGRVFDAAKLRLQTEYFNADFFTSRVVIPEDERFNVANDYDWFSGVYASSTTLIARHTLDLYFLSRNASPQAATAEPHPQAPQPSARDIYTLGVRLKSTPGQLGSWDYTLDLMGQLGNFRDPRAGAPAERLDHEAYAVVAQGGYTFTDAWSTPRLGLEYAHGSGDSDAHDGRHGTFENLFPTNHKFYGYMDFFSLQNLHDFRAIFQMKPHSRVSLALEGHAFLLADTHDSFYTAAGTARGGTAATPGTGYGVNPGYGSYVGSELDLVSGYAVTRFAQLEAGFGHFFVGDYVRESLSAATHGSTDANWFYLQFTLTF
ncbi:MAG TPA: alginate export family protein, partial [Candidatus Dormibacteraeota bacterium]|nr:alginate export family protein [Candidatus Dormibacteraeota bacterium]